jgi:hypothetical protein
VPVSCLFVCLFICLSIFSDPTPMCADNGHFPLLEHRRALKLEFNLICLFVHHNYLYYILDINYKKSLSYWGIKYISFMSSIGTAIYACPLCFEQCITFVYVVYIQVQVDRCSCSDHFLYMLLVQAAGY